MENMHLVGEDEEDIYQGFNDFDAALDTQNLQEDEGFQKAVMTSHGRRPPTTMGARSAVKNTGMGATLPSRYGSRLATGIHGTLADGPARPMTAVKGAGFGSNQKGQPFDPMNSSSSVPPLDQKGEDTNEEKIKQLEKKVNELIEESCIANYNGENELALDKAKDAGRKERILVRLREQISFNEQLNLDLTYSVLFNLAIQYACNELYTEALNTYQVIVKNKMFNNAGRLKVNMGNIYFMQKEYAKAVKMYRMALDQIPNTNKGMRMKFMQNIGITFVKLKQYTDAIGSFEHIMESNPDFTNGFNLILCYCAIGDREKMKYTFTRLLAIENVVTAANDDDDKYSNANTDDKQTLLIQEVIKNDSLRKIERQKKVEAERCIMMAAKIIAPLIETSYAAGYEWCNDQVKLSAFVNLGHVLDVDKAIGYLKQKDFNLAIETLKSFEKKDSKITSTAATNLSFLYILECDHVNAEKYVGQALSADRYNPLALVNKGNILFNHGDYEKAREFYTEALNNDYSCIEAQYNMGLCNKNVQRYDIALESFYKLQGILHNNAQVIYQIADIHDKLKDTAQAVEWFLQLIGIVPYDARVLQRLGEIYEAEGDKSQAFQFHFDSYRYNPTNIAVIEWLGAYYIESQFVEKAITYFDRASMIQPNEIKWQLMVASCYRRSGNYQQAMSTYKLINKLFPNNVECLKFLIRISSDMGLPDSEDFTGKLRKAEKIAKIKDERSNSASNRHFSGRRRDSKQISIKSDIPPKNSSYMQPPSDIFKDIPNKNEFNGEPDADYNDPLGPNTMRPMIAVVGPAKGRVRADEDDFANEELGDDLLPE